MNYHAYLLVIKTEQKTGHILGPIEGKTKKGGSAHPTVSACYVFKGGPRRRGPDPVLSRRAFRLNENASFELRATGCWEIAHKKDVH